MRHICERVRTYATLFAVVAVISTVISNTAAYVGLPQYAYNLMYGAVITIYMLENWSLLMELNKRNDDIAHDSKNTDIIKELTQTNNRLVKALTVLTEGMETHKSGKQKESESKSMEALKNKWNSCCETTNIPNISIANVHDTMNTAKIPRAPPSKFTKQHGMQINPGNCYSI
jgi:hypothetical protein